MEAGTFIMLGYPGETKKDIALTIEHLKKSMPSFYTITLAYPITGTPLEIEEHQNIETSGAWNLVSDRQSKLKRKYSDQFYNNALKWVNHEMQFEKSVWGIRKVKHKVKSLWAQSKMLVS
jgi:anaerobic magnesium-protoporphyrin IX monomethyl ester cyclase